MENKTETNDCIQILGGELVDIIKTECDVATKPVKPKICRQCGGIRTRQGIYCGSCYQWSYVLG